MRQVIILASLLAILLTTAELGARSQSDAAFDASTLTATGFILLAAYAFGELFRRLRLPALLGYLAAGILFGPSFAGLFVGDPAIAPIHRVALDQLGLVNMLAVGVIGTMGGGEIRIADLRENFRKVALISIFTFVLVLPSVTALVLGLSFFAPDLVPFLAGVTTEGRIAAAILFGTLAVGMSPSATLALLLEVRAHGRFTSLVLGTVVFADLVLVATFLLALALAKILVSPEGFSATGMLDVLPAIGAEFGWAILLGIIVGLVFIAYLRLVGRELLLFSLGVIFVTSFVASRLHAETLLAFLVAGFIVQNFSRHGHELIEAFERIAMPVFVIYFTTQAANLDLVAVTVYLPLTLVLVATRCALFFWGIGAATRLARVDDTQRRLLRVSFFSQGGVDLVLAAMVAQAIPSWGVDVQTVTVATILFYIVMGPPLLARALDQAGESAAARERGAEMLVARTVRRDDTRREVTFPPIRTGDAVLDSRLLELGELVMALRIEVVQGAAERAQRRRERVTALAEAITTRLSADDATTDAITPDPQVLRQRLRAMHAELARASADWDAPDLLPIDPTALQSAFDRLSEAKSLGSVYRLKAEAALFEPRGSRWQRAIRFVRRIRRALFGPGMRTVPVGRLWRFHVALDVPVAFWSSIRADESEVWGGLARHYRLSARALDDLAAGRPPSPDRAAARSMSGGSLVTSHEALERVDAGESDRPLLVSMHDAHTDAVERERALLATLLERDLALERDLEIALGDAWAAFSASVEVAGTLEHPAWHYRVSKRYDTAQAAMADLRERLQQQVRAAAGARDAAAALAHASHLARRAEATGDELIGAIELDTREDAPSLEHASRLCATLATSPAPAPDVWAELSRTLVGTATALERLARRLQEAESLRERSTALAAAITTVPDTVAPSPLTQLEPHVDRTDRRIPIRLRTWLDHALAREVMVAMLDARAESARRVAEVGASLHHARQVLEYHVVTAQDGAQGLDHGVAERLAPLVDRARSDLQGIARAASVQLRPRVTTAIHTALAPIVDGRWEEVQRRVRRIDDAGAVRATLADRVRARSKRAMARASRTWRRTRNEVAAVFVDQVTPDAIEGYRRLLFGPRTTMPDAYERLFTSVPAESVGLIVPRPEADPMIMGIERWLEGRGGPILVRGDRGVGKRTLVREVLARVGDRLEPHWLGLSPELESEADVSRALSQLLGRREASGFAELGRFARTAAGADEGGAPSRAAVVVSNVERLFRRTPAGLPPIRRFFDLVAATSDEVLWIVLFAEPAARLLGPVLELEGRFPVTIHLPPMTTEQLERVLTTRHRLSGYELRFAHHAPSLHEWLRTPAAAWQTRQHAGAATYERLRLLSAGNVRQAMRLWLAGARRDPVDEAAVVVGPFDAMPDGLLDALPLISKVILAALLLHGPLRRDELSAVSMRQGHALDAEITHLVHLGFVVLEPATGGANDTRLIEVRTRLVSPLTEELRACNLL